VSYSDLLPSVICLWNCPLRPNKINYLILRPFLSKSDEGMRFFFFNFIEVKIDDGNFFFSNFSICFYNFFAFFLLSVYLICSMFLCFRRVVECWLFISHSLILMSFSFSHSFIIIFSLNRALWHSRRKTNYPRNHFIVYNVHPYFCEK